MTPCTCFDQLTDVERRTFCNGCGGKGGVLRPLHWWGLESDCDHHDLAYLLGGTEADRLAADRQLHDSIQARCDGAPLWKRWYYRAQAWAYYRAVRACGAKFFTYRDRPMTCDELLHRALPYASGPEIAARAAALRPPLVDELEIINRIAALRQRRKDKP